MANYNETTVSGSEYTRCPQLVISNTMDSVPQIQFYEENVTLLSDGRKIFTPQGHMQRDFDPAKTIQLLDPNTGLPTGVEATYGDAYIILFSAYMAAAVERDAAAVVV